MNTEKTLADIAPEDFALVRPWWPPCRDTGP